MTKAGYAALTVLLLAGGWLYVRYRQAERKVVAYEHSVMTPENYIEYVAAEALREGRLAPVVREERLSLLVVLDERGCATCIAVEMDHLNRYWSELKAITRVVYAGRQGIYLKENALRFDYARVPDVRGVWGRDMAPVNPVALLFIDGHLVAVRLANPTMPFYEDYTTAWYEGIRTLWARVQELS
jgi:hypothetical protein